VPIPCDDARRAFGDARVSSQRRAIVEAACTLRGAFTVEELTEATRSRDVSAGTATVYRAVGALEASGWLEQVGKRGESALYARCDAGSRHHHHVVCERCGRVEATECPVRVSPADGGFVVTRHEVTLYGLCPACMQHHEQGA
jgi:Fur family transcriptional regulator, ferric uptake regulator